MTQQAEQTQAPSPWSEADKAAIESAATADERRKEAEFVLALAKAREKCGTAALDRVFGGQKGGSFSYRYASSEEIIRVARDAMMGCNLVIFPKTVEVVVETAADGARSSIIRKMTVIHVAGGRAEASIEWPVVTTPGRPRDKALAAAATASLAYLLRDLLLIERAGEVEEDEDEDEPAPYRRPAGVAVARSNGPSGRAVVPAAAPPAAAPPAAAPAAAPAALAPVAAEAAPAAHQGVAVVEGLAAHAVAAAAALAAAAPGVAWSVADAARELVKDRIGRDLGERLLAAPANKPLDRPVAVEVINAVATACGITAPAVTVRFKLVQGVVPTAKTLIDAITLNWPKAED